MAEDDAVKLKRLLKIASDHRERAEWELAENALHDAEILCNGGQFSGSEQCHLDILFELAEVTRRHGKYGKAVDAHTRALQSPIISESKRVAVMGELGVNYRQMNQFNEASKVLEKQYTLTKRLVLEMESQTCRAAGNLGMTRYQLFEAQADKTDKTLLMESISLLEERVQSAQAIQSKLDGLNDHAKLRRTLKTWESIGYSRLSLAYAANGDIKNAVNCGRKTVEMTRDSADPTVRALSRFFYGNALLNSQQTVEAKSQFNFTESGGQTTVAIALCKEPSEEHRGYLQTVTDVGVDLDAFDEQGYSALDYAVYSNDAAMVGLIKEALVRTVGNRGAEDRENMALLRKHFRETFQLHFRPILGQGRTGCVQDLRRKYMELLADDPSKHDRFDHLRLINYAEFRRCGKLPRFHPGENKSRTFAEINENTRGKEPFVVFISYRWIGRTSDPGRNSPDDESNTQYLRMLGALSDLLSTHNQIDPEMLYIWLDCACIDQDDIEPGRRDRGISSLPIYLAQCNAMISLVDSQYVNRAWCAVELLIMQTLRESYSPEIFRWYEHRLHAEEIDRIHGTLRPGTPLKVHPSALALSHESDRKHVLFLERQSMLLGKAAADAR